MLSLDINILNREFTFNGKPSGIRFTEHTHKEYLVFATIAQDKMSIVQEQVPVEEYDRKEYFIKLVERFIEFLTNGSSTSIEINPDQDEVLVLGALRVMTGIDK